MSYVKSVLKTCTPCKGNGHRGKRMFKDGKWVIVDIPCTRCQGTGKVKKSRNRR